MLPPHISLCPEHVTCHTGSQPRLPHLVMDRVGTDPVPSVRGHLLRGGHC